MVTTEELRQRRTRKEPPDAFEHKHAQSDAQRHAESHRNATHQCSCLTAMQAHICACRPMHINTDTHRNVVSSQILQWLIVFGRKAGEN